MNIRFFLFPFLYSMRCEAYAHDTGQRKESNEDDKPEYTVFKISLVPLMEWDLYLLGTVYPHDCGSVI